jgi:glycosyltransferase involved in cell wall biosynthesis
MKIDKKKVLSVLEVVPSLDLRDGGLPRAVISLASSVGAIDDTDVALLSSSLDITSIIDLEKVNFINLSGLPKSKNLFDFFGARKLFFNLVREHGVELIHSHGIWSPTNHWACYVGRKVGMPTIIQPHGMLEPWALDQKKIKKKMALSIYQKSDLLNANIFVATSELEYESMRDFGLTQPIAIIPNGIKILNFSNPVKILKASQKKSVLFLSRIHPKKGLDNLLKAWSELDVDGWNLIIAGSGDDNYLSELFCLCKKLKIESTVRFVGNLVGHEKDNAFKSARLFVLPSYSENFGIAVLEALSFGVPVITTKATPWQDLDKNGCGWSIDIGVPPLKCALQEGMILDESLRGIMGAKCVDYAKKFDLEVIGQEMRNVYMWLKGLEARPNSVQIN